ncbi:hypothetical protein MMC12_003438 [Toensbergia leucococca]|nr:hypothetical protein [Toensbergia leucococca]
MLVISTCAVPMNGTNCNITEWIAHPEGVFHLGPDGVLRSLDGNHTVLNYAQLSPAQVDVFIQGQDNYALLKQEFKGIDGRNVTDLALLNEQPALALVPRSLVGREPYYMPPPTQAAGPPVYTVKACNDLYCTNSGFCRMHVCGSCQAATTASLGKCNDLGRIDLPPIYHDQLKRDVVTKEWAG